MPAWEPSLHAKDYFSIVRPKLGLDASYEYWEDKRKTPDSNTRTTYHDIRENLSVKTNGWVYHPGIMSYDLFFQPGFRQEKFEDFWPDDDTVSRRRQDSSLLAYDIKTTLLEKKPCSVNLYARQNDWHISRSQNQTTDIKSEIQGGRFTFSNKTLPVTIGIANTQSTQNGYYRSDEDRNEQNINVGWNTPNSFTELTMQHSETDRTTIVSTGYPEPIGIESDTTNTELTNTTFFRHANPVRLDSLAYHYITDQDDSERKTLQVSENLFWVHNKNLETRYGLKYDRQDYDTYSARQQSIKAALTHRYMQALTTTFGGAAASSRLDTTRQDLYRTNLGLNYRRKIPAGKLSLSAAFSYEMTNREGDEAIIPVVNERHVLTTAKSTYLDNENADIDTLIVTDVTGSIIYIENIDYLIQVVGSDTRIDRIPLGAIEDGQTVLVSYNYTIDASYDDALFTQDYGIDLNLWTFMYLTYTHRLLNNSLISADPPYLSGNIRPPEDDDTIDIAQVRLVSRWAETRFLYEKQDRNSGNSQVARSIRQYIHYSPMRDFMLNFTGYAGDRDYTDTGDTENFYSVGADMEWTPTWWCLLRLTGTQSAVSGDLQDTDATSVTTGIKLIYGIWQCRISYRFIRQNDNEVDNRRWSQRIYFIVKRSLW